MVCNTWVRGSRCAMYTVGASDIKVSLYGSDNELGDVHEHCKKRIKESGNSK